jgi:hypothetical protein
MALATSGRIESSETCPPSISIVDESVDRFVGLARQFIAAMEEMYPTCPGIKALKLEFTMAIDHALTESMKMEHSMQLVRNFHETMTPLYDAAASHNDSIFSSEVELLAKVKMADKWLAACADTKDCIWEYLDNLAKIAQTWALYSAVPRGMMDKITEAAVQLSEEVQSGGLESLNIARLANIGQSVVSNVDQEELQNFAHSVLSNGQIMQTCMNNMGALAGMMGGGAGSPGGQPNPFAMGAAMFGGGLPGPRPGPRRHDKDG